MKTTKNKIFQQFTIVFQRIKRLEPDITDKYYMKNILKSLSQKQSQKMIFMHLEPLIALFFIVGAFLGYNYFKKPI